MRILLVALSLVAAVGFAGCKKEEQPKKLTATDYQKQIDDVKADPKMPDNIKQGVIGMLEAQKQKAEQEAARGR